MMNSSPNHEPILSPRDRAPASLSVVVPCYNEQEVFEELLNRVSATAESLGCPWELVLVDDGSKDRTWEMMVAAQRGNEHIKAVRLARNFGHQYALTCGLDQARGEVVVIMDADLQDPPELIPEMFDKWRQGYDVVYGKRSERKGETWLKRFLAYCFYRVLTGLTKTHIPSDTGDFRLIDRRALEALRSMREYQRFIRGMVSWVGYPQTPIYYERNERAAGVTKYPVRKSLLLAIDAITSFTYAPLRFASYLGFALSVFAFFYIVVIIVLKVLDINFPGYTSIMGAILLLGGVQLLVLGIMGEYVGRTFEQTKQRPLYLVQDIQGEPLGDLKTQYGPEPSSQ